MLRLLDGDRVQRGLHRSAGHYALRLYWPQTTRAEASDRGSTQMGQHAAWTYDAVGESVLHLLTSVSEGRAPVNIFLVRGGVAEYVSLRLREDLATLCHEVRLGIGPTPALLFREELPEQYLPLFVQLGVQALVVLRRL